MPSLFSRRRGSSASRASVQLPLDRSTTSNAAAAASQAFLARVPSNGSLSSAAAAAALRSHTTSPEPVGSIQTKRMIRRGSQSSIGSGSVMSGRGDSIRGGLQRQNSGGSMTERSFRSPSPGRANGAMSPRNAPPVPAIPKNIPAGHHRSSSLGPPARVLSPTRGGRATSLDRTSKPPPSGARPKKRLSNVNEEVERSDSNRNVNFSRPRSSQPASPVSPTADNPYTHGTGNWFSEPVTTVAQPQRSSKETALEQKISRIQAAAGQSVKQDRSVTSSQGAYVARANAASETGARPNAPTIPVSSATEMETIMVYDSNSRTFVPQLRPKPTASEPPSPTLPRVPAPAPGTYDPNTRKIVQPIRRIEPIPEPKALIYPGMPQSAPAVSTPQKPEHPASETDIEPPARNPARLSPSSTSSPLRQLHKQPSIVREEPEDEKALINGAASLDTAKVVQPSISPARVDVTPNAQKQRSGSLDVPRASLDSGARGRDSPGSSSPQRSAHFSASPVVAPVLHKPPPRDFSPAKSALKHHSPASSVRTSSPYGNVSSTPKSPTSEKKSVRVSFDEQPQVVEASTAAGTPSATTRDRSPLLDNLDDEDLMKPRPALPSFGSVRKQRNTPAENFAGVTAERQDASSDHAIGGILKDANGTKPLNDPLPPDVVSKESAGYVSDESDDVSSGFASSTLAAIAKVNAESHSDEPKVRDFAPAPDANKSDAADVPAINLLPPTPGVEDEGRNLLDREGEQSPKAKSSFDINVPGGWDKNDENQAEVSSAGAATATAAALTARHDVAEVPDEEPIIYGSPQQQSPLLEAINEDSDTDSAEFSDAAEDLSELDNGGYASLNAIAVSPVVHAPPADEASVKAATPPDSPSVQQASRKADNGVADVKHGNKVGSGDWTEATAYWSQLSKQQRQQIERQHMSSDDEEQPVATIRKTKKKTTSKGVVAPATNGATAVQQSGRSVQPAPPTMKKTMRAQPDSNSSDGDVHMRRSMRAGGGSGMATTLRGGPQSAKQPATGDVAEGFQQKTLRPVPSGNSTAGPAMLRKQDRPIAAQQDSASRIQPRAKPPPAPVMTAKLQRELGNDSDSESSFKKSRRTRSAANSSGKYSMKRSMRGEPAQTSAPAREERPVSPSPGGRKGRDSFSIRSLSPTGSLFGRKKRVDDVRQTLRGHSVESGARMTLRNNPPAKTSTHVTKPQSAAISRFKSRFVDSDDEDRDDRPARNLFRSRFADSDDEDDDVFIPADLTPVRGIPRRQGQSDGDSTDLEDEDDNDHSRKASRKREKMSQPLVPDSTDIDKAMEIARKKLGIAEPRPDSVDSSTVQAPQPEPKSGLEDVDLTPDKKKRGFMGSILRRNRGSTASVPQISSPGIYTPSEAPSTPVAVRPSSILATQPVVVPQSPVGSSRKLMRRSSAQQAPRLRRGDSNYSNATAPPAVGESRIGGDWPLPATPRIPDDIDTRPNTSDGNPADRPGSVRFAEPGSKAAAIYSQRTGKKKKFSMLRRAFGLDD